MFRNVIPSKKKIRICFWKNLIKFLMKYLHITCGDTLSFCFFLCGGEGEFSGQGFFLGGGRVRRGGRAVCFLTLGWWAGVVALPLHLCLCLSLARWRRQILLSFPLCKTFVLDLLSSWIQEIKWSEWLNPCYIIIWLEIASFYRFLLLKFPPHY